MGRKKKAPVTEQRLKDALLQLRFKSLRKVSKATGIPKSTLHECRQQSRASPDGPLKQQSHANQVLSSEQEKELHDYLIQTQKEGYGLTPKMLKELAFSYCSHNHIEMPSTWSKNGCAGKQWFCEFMKRHRKLSLRKPESTSIARAKCMNRPVMNNFYDQIGELIEKYNFEACDIFNIDETNNPTVLQAAKVIAQAGVKQVISLLTITTKFESYLIFIIFRFIPRFRERQEQMSQCAQ